MRYRLRTLLVVLALGPPLLALCYFGPFVAVWSGRFTVDVQFANNTGKAIDRLDAAVVNDRGTAKMLVAHPDAEGGWLWKPISLDTHCMAQLDVKCSGRETWLGREFGYWQQRAIAIRVVFEDGSETRFVVDTPRQRGTMRSLVVNISGDD